MLDHLADLESDFSAIHRIWLDFEAEEYGGLSSKRFFQMAERLPAYQGIIQSRAMAEEQARQEEERGTPIGPATSGRPPVDADGPVKVIPLTPELAAGGMAALGLAGVVDYDTSG